MKYSCRDYQKMVQPFLNHQLPDRQLKGFLDHIEGCSKCKDELETYFIVDYSLRYLEHEEDRTYDLQSLLEERIREEAYDLRVRRIFRILVPIGLLILIGVGAVLILGDMAPELLSPVQDRLMFLIKELWRVK